MHFFLAVLGAFLLFISPVVTAADDAAVSAETVALLKTFSEEFVAITPGEGKFPATFRMGSETIESERPVHDVTIKHQFAIAKYEVPQNLYEAVMGTNPSRWKGPRNSVEMMSWRDANNFCGKITTLMQNQKLIEKDDSIRLPTEAEWEYCCRAGTTTRYSFGDDAQRDGDDGNKASLLDKYGWHTGNAAGNDPPVGALLPNLWGLYDMHGYLWELTADEWTGYENTPTDGSAAKNAVRSGFVVMRSGSWKDRFDSLTSSTRRKVKTTATDDAIGFRCVKSRAIRLEI